MATGTRWCPPDATGAPGGALIAGNELGGREPQGESAGRDRRWRRAPSGGRRTRWVPPVGQLLREIPRAVPKMATGVVPAGRDALIAGNPPSGLEVGDGHPTNPLAGVTTPRREEGRAHRRLRGCGNRTQPGGLQGNQPAVRRRGGEQTAVATAQGPRGASLAKPPAGVTTPRREAGRIHRESKRGHPVLYRST